MTVKEKLRRAFEAVKGPQARGSVKWFRDRLEAEGVAVSTAAVYRYVNGEGTMPEAVARVLALCHEEAREVLRKRMEVLR